MMLWVGLEQARKRHYVMDKSRMYYDGQTFRCDCGCMRKPKSKFAELLDGLRHTFASWLRIGK